VTWLAVRIESFLRTTHECWLIGRFWVAFQQGRACWLIGRFWAAFLRTTTSDPRSGQGAVTIVVGHD
jgi:hypothetical protein